MTPPGSSVFRWIVVVISLLIAFFLVLSMEFSVGPMEHWMGSWLREGHYVRLRYGGMGYERNGRPFLITFLMIGVYQLVFVLRRLPAVQSLIQRIGSQT